MGIGLDFPCFGEGPDFSQGLVSMPCCCRAVRPVWRSISNNDFIDNIVNALAIVTDDAHEVHPVAQARVNEFFNQRRIPRRRMED